MAKDKSVADEPKAPEQVEPAPEKPKKVAKKAPTKAPKKAKAKSEAPLEESQPEAPVDLTPEEEVEKTGQLEADGPNGIDGSGILTHTNEDVIRNFPKNENGQVVIGSDGQIVGLEASQQPTQPSGAPE